jgi:hypothetical protein
MVLEHVSNGTYPLHVRDDISPDDLVPRSRRRFASAESVRKTDGQTPFGVYGTADTNALKSARLGFGQGDDAQRSGTRWVSSKDWRRNLVSSADILASAAMALSPDERHDRTKIREHRRRHLRNSSNA